MFDIAPDMTQNSGPSREHYDRYYPRVLERAGLTNDDDRAPEFERRIREIFNGYWAARERPTIAVLEDALKAYLTGQEMVRTAWSSLKSIESEIYRAADLFALSPEDREDKIEGYLELRAETDHLTREEFAQWGDIEPAVELDELILERDCGIRFLKDNPQVLARLLKRRTGDYRMPNETALVVHPALDLLDSIGFTPSRTLPRKAFFEALLNLLGVEPELRPSAESINVVVDERRKRLRRSQH